MISLGWGPCKDVAFFECKNILFKTDKKSIN